MKSIKHRYAELLNLTQLFLLREYSLQDVKMVDPAILAFFQSKMKFSPALPKKIQQLPTSAPPAQNVNPSVRATPIPPSSQPPKPQPENPRLEPLPPPTQPKPAISSNPQPPVIQDKSVKGKEFSLEPMTAAPLHDNRELWKLCQTLFPEWSLCETIPSDALAQKNKNAWLKGQEIPPVIILSFHDNEQQLSFLKNIAQAISLRLAPARVLSAPKLEKENGWENVLNSPSLRLVIASDYGLYLQPKLMQFYRELPQQSKHYLNQTPLLLLSDLALYLKEPQLKPLLWRAICNEFATSQLHRSI